jgi:hypothetical protein
MVTDQAKSRTKGFQHEYEEQSFTYVTEYAFKKIQLQMDLSKDVTVNNKHSVLTSTGNINVGQDRCPCSTFMSLHLPCRHIFAYCDMPLFCPGKVAEVDTAFNNNHMPHYAATPKVLILQTPQKRVLI